MNPLMASGGHRFELWHEWNSVHSYKVRIVLAEKGLPWADRRVELFKFEHSQPAYLAINPEGVVPTLVHDGRPLYDSSLICLWLDEEFPEPALQPKDAYARLFVRRWLKYHDDLAHATVRDASFQLLYKPHYSKMPLAELQALVMRHPNPARRKKFLDAANAEIDWAQLLASARSSVTVATRIDARLRMHGKAWLEGDAFSLADVAMAPFAERIVNLGFRHVWDGLPAGAAWSDRLMARASVQGSRPPKAFQLPVPGEDVLAELRRRLTDTDSQ